MLLDRARTLDPGIFRTYDIRGIVGKTLTEEDVYLIGKAIGSCVREQGETAVCVARDGRNSSPVLVKALAKGILQSGCDVVDLGMVPTPLLYYATHILEQRSGVMLTGSHNPSEYNGLKIVINRVSLSESDIKNLYHRIIAERFTSGHGTARSQPDLVDRYVEDVAKQVSLARPLSIVVDAGNGVTGQIAPRLFRALGCEVHELFCEINGNFPNHHPDPSEAVNLQHLISRVREKQADVGLAFDGDGDRLGVVTNRGEIIWSDRLLMLFAKTILAAQPNVKKIIYDVKCTNHLASLIRSLGGEPIIWKTGHSLIKAKVSEEEAVLAGEMSGHFFFKDKWYGFDDALYAGARLLEILSEQADDSHTVFVSIPNSVNTPELKIQVAEEEKFSLMQRLINGANFTTAKEIMTIDGLRVSFDEGWGLLRASNTTPCLILRFEAVSQIALENIQTLFRNWILAVKPNLVLPF